MVQLFVPSMHELHEKYGDGIRQMVNDNIKIYSRDKKLQVMISGKRNIEKFCKYYNALSDFEKLRYCYFNYHPIPKNLEFPCTEWKWVLEIKYFPRKKVKKRCRFNQSHSKKQVNSSTCITDTTKQQLVVNSA